MFQFCVSNPRSYDGMWKSLKVTPQRNQPGISHFIQTTEDSVCCLSFTRGTVKQMARRQHGSKMNWVSGWVLTCLRTSECMWEFMYTVQFVRWGRRAATAGSGRFWSSGCQNPQPRHVRRRWERVPAGRTAGLLRCWCRRGRSRCHRTPGIQTEEAPSSVSFAVFGIMSARCAYSWLTLKTHAWIKNPKKMQQGVKFYSCMLRQGVLNWPVSCCCPSRPLWCSHWRPRPLLWGRWTGRCLRRSNQTSAKTPLLCWTPALLLWHGDNNVKWLTKQINWRMDLLIKCSLLNAKKKKVHHTSHHL